MMKIVEEYKAAGRISSRIRGVPGIMSNYTDDQSVIHPVSGVCCV